MTGLQKLHEGKAKIVYATDDPEVYLQDFKDAATAFDGKKKGTIRHKGRMNNAISARLFSPLRKPVCPRTSSPLRQTRACLFVAWICSKWSSWCVT